jgi:hypothetical protein
MKETCIDGAVNGTLIVKNWGFLNAAISGYVCELVENPLLLNSQNILSLIKVMVVVGRRFDPKYPPGFANRYKNNI